MENKKVVKLTVAVISAVALSVGSMIPVQDSFADTGIRTKNGVEYIAPVDISSELKEAEELAKKELEAKTAKAKAEAEAKAKAQAQAKAKAAAQAKAKAQAERERKQAMKPATRGKTLQVVKKERRQFSVYSESGGTSSGFKLAGHSRESAMCVATRSYPLGTKLRLTFPSRPEMNGVYTVLDRTAKKYGHRIDVFMGAGKSKKYLYNIGVGPVIVEVLK